MTKNILLLFAILLLQNPAFAVGGKEYNTTTTIEHDVFNSSKKGIFSKLKNRILKKKVEKILNKINTAKTTDCDRIVFYNGEELEVTIVDIKKNTVTYKECGAPGPAIDSLDCSDVDVIFRADNTEYICRHPNLPRRSSKANFVRINNYRGDKISYKTTHFCDLLVLMNKDQLDVEIVEMNDDEIVYKDCHTDNDTVTIPAEEVRTIRYKDGFSKRINFYENEMNASDKMVRGFGKAILIVLLAIVLMFGALALILAALLF